jgi:type IV pilus assembly protein PilV
MPAMNTTLRSPSPARHAAQRGISLIEVLVVLVLFSFGLIGMVGLQARAVQTSVGAEDSARAALLANDLAARMWGARSVTLDSAVIDDWNDRVADPTQGGLPNAAGTVDVASGVATITVTWKPPHEPATAASHVYRTQVIQ